MLKYWREILLISLYVMAFSVPAADCDSATDFVKDYYASLNKGHVGEVLAKWYKPKNPSKLRKSVANTESASVEDSKLKSCAAGKATVYVEVVVAAHKKPAERWSGNIQLLDSDDEWKIKAMDLKKIEEPGC